MCNPNSVLKEKGKIGSLAVGRLTKGARSWLVEIGRKKLSIFPIHAVKSRTTVLKRYSSKTKLKIILTKSKSRVIWNWRIQKFSKWFLHKPNGFYINLKWFLYKLLNQSESSLSKTNSRVQSARHQFWFNHIGTVSLSFAHAFDKILVGLHES